MIKKCALWFFLVIVGRFSGTGWGHYPPVRAVYQYMRQILMPKKEVLVTIHGCKMYVHGASEYEASDELVFTEGYEREQTTLFKKVVKEGMTVVDIGANIGYYTLIASKIVGVSGKVMSFEPEPSNLRLLLQNIEVNGCTNVEPLSYAVADKLARKRLYLSNPGEHSLYTSGDKYIVVNVIKLDSLIHQVDVIKMDVEGAELPALIGMADLVKNNDVKLFTEFYPDGFQRAGCTPREFWDKLVEYGFTFIYLIDERKRKVELTDYLSAVVYCRNGTYTSLYCSKIPLESK